LDGSAKDATYLTGESWHEKDKARFMARMAAGFPLEAVT
jgi:hypothetical protein